jgi:hypothetical protein
LLFCFFLFCLFGFFFFFFLRLFVLFPHRTVVVTKLCIPHLLEVKGKAIRGVGGVADKEAYGVHTINIISQQQYFIARCLSSCVGNVFGLHMC